MSIRVECIMDTKVLIVVILAAGIVGGVTNNYIGDYFTSDDEEPTPENTMSTVKLGQKAPDFSVSDIDGNEFNLSDFKGESVVVLEFMNTGCGTCHNFEKKVLKEYYNDTERPEDVVLISITQSVESRDKVADRVQGDWIWAIGNDEITTAFEAERSPSVVIIDKDGLVTFCESGTMSKSELEEKVNNAL